MFLSISSSSDPRFQQIFLNNDPGCGQGIVWFLCSNLFYLFIFWLHLTVLDRTQRAEAEQRRKMQFHHQPGCCDYPLRTVAVWHSFAKYRAVRFILGQGRFQVCNSDLIHHIKYLVSSVLKCIYCAAHERDRYCRIKLQYEKSC